MKPSERIAELRREIVEKELADLAEAAGLGVDPDLRHFRQDALEDPRTAVAAIVKYLDEKHG